MIAPPMAKGIDLKQIVAVAPYLRADRRIKVVALAITAPHPAEIIEIDAKLLQNGALDSVWLTPGAPPGVSTAAQAQTYQRLGNTIIGSDGSMAQPLGNGTLITQPPAPPQFGQPLPPPRQVFCQPLRNTVICN
jgi:hypothetical protein